ncbi:hypothetical protein LguiB_029987 [Lonicera macranthoides]
MSLFISTNKFGLMMYYVPLLNAYMYMKGTNHVKQYASGKMLRTFGKSSTVPVSNHAIIFLKNLFSASSSASSPKFPHLFVHPVLRSPHPRAPQLPEPLYLKVAGVIPLAGLITTPPFHHPPHQALGHQIFCDSAWFAGIGIPQGRPTFTTFSLVSSNPFGFKDEALAGGGYRMWTPGQSGTCLPAIGPGIDQNTDIPLSEVVSDEFAFGINGKGLVKAWEGEKIHEVMI